MKKLLKIVLITLFSLFLIVCIAGYIILSKVDLNQYKGKITQIVQDATGRELNIGEIKIKPAFSPTVELSQVTFSNATWSKEPLMASIGAVDVSVELLPLMHKSIVIKRFLISDAVVNLEENKDGSANWIFETKEEKSEEEGKTSYNFSLISVAEAAEITEPETSESNILSSIVIKEVALDNVKINYTDKTAKKQTYDIETLRLDENDDKNIDFIFKVNDGLYAGKGTVGALTLLDTDKAYPVKADLEVMGIKVTTDLALYHVLKDISFAGSIGAKGFLGKDSSYNESAEIQVKGDLKEIAAVIKSVQLAGNVITGDVIAKLDGKVPAINAVLNSDKIDIASFTKPRKTAWAISLISEAKATTLVSADAIPYDVLSAVNADADISIAKIVNGNATLLSNLKINAKVNNGVAVLKVLQGQLAKGNIKADATLSAKNKTLALNADMTKVNLLELLNALDAQSDTFRVVNGGDTDLFIKLNGTGNTYAQVVDSLSGQLSLIVDKSALHLGNIGMMKGNVLSQLLNTLKITKGNDDLNLACAVVRTDVKDGLAKFPNGIVVNADKFTVVANGDVNLKNDKIGLSIKPFGGKLTDTNIAKALSSLVKVTGTLQKPTVGIDTANVVKNVVGATMTGPVYLGAQMAMENDNSPCYTALKGTGYEDRFPKSDNLAKSTTDEAGKVLDSSVDMVKDTAKGLLNMFSGKKRKNAQ